MSPALTALLADAPPAAISSSLRVRRMSPDRLDSVQARGDEGAMTLQAFPIFAFLPS